MTIIALLSLQALLSCPNPDDPQDAVVSTQYKADRKLWEKTGSYLTRSSLHNDMPAMLT
jgi:ubiquitin-conjugating enzyme (huntingtin interacting protein 2)